jgi:MFS family permease
VAPNPLGIPGADQLLEAVDVIAATLSVPVFLAAVASVVVRFRRARDIERQQLKWFVYASLVVVAGFTLSSTLPTLIPGISELVLDLVVTGLALAWPVALGIAILRYRLYEIDRLINRTLVYALLTALLGGVYAGAVLVLGQVFGGVSSNPPSWAVAGATLAAAALFQPARRRIQQIVDRRFNRRKYDAVKTIDAFSARLREEVDLDTLSAELLTVVDQTMQPTTASLWLGPQRVAGSKKAKYCRMEVRAWWSCGAGLLVAESAKKPAEVGLGVAPVEWGGGLLIAVLEGQQLVLDLGEIGEVVGRQHFALHDREVDLDLVQPGGVHWQVDQAQVPPAAFQPVDRGLAAVGAAIVDDPEHSLGRGVGLGSHDLGDQPAERVDARGGLHAAEQVGVVDIPGGQVRQRSAAVVFVLDAHTARRACWPGRMAAAARLDLGLLIRREHILVVTQQLALEDALVQVQNTAGLGGEVWGTREDPRVVPPRLDGILGQPAAQRRGRDRLDQPAADDLSPQLLKAPPADRDATGHR